MLSRYEQVLLEGWEDTHKKSQLTLWILLSLKHGPKHMSDMKEFIYNATSQTITADDKSMYRALRRFADAELITYTSEKSESGPDKKVYVLTEIGKTVLQEFITKHITNVFFNAANKPLFSV